VFTQRNKPPVSGACLVRQVYFWGKLVHRAIELELARLVDPNRDHILRAKLALIAQGLGAQDFAVLAVAETKKAPHCRAIWLRRRRFALDHTARRRANFKPPMASKPNSCKA
jgi:hypothetical protein